MELEFYGKDRQELRLTLKWEGASMSDPCRALCISGDEHEHYLCGASSVFLRRGTPPVQVACVHFVRGPGDPVHGDLVVGTTAHGELHMPSSDEESVQYMASLLVH